MEDEQIMREVSAGDVARLEVLFERHHRALFQFFLHQTGNRATSEDLVQEVFFRILKYRHTWKPGTGFRAWLFQIGRNAWRDHAGRHPAEIALPETMESFASAAPSPARQAEDREDTEFLRRALASMPAEKKEVLILSRFLDMKYDEIAAALECEVGTVKVRVYRALRELGERFFALRGERA
ncbi:MAG: RNA polymerase sigma factor [Bryobacteraceae bacterium]|jgi:RNA polymerase sigma-70 factor (ECF subfamily)